jgi:ABC-type transport system involved in multi-copper enzyme maturation permease subunit
MIGPVLRQELLLGGRRQRLYLFRWIYAGWLVILVLYCYARYYGQESERRNYYYNNYQYVTPTYNSVSAPQAVGAQFTNLFLYQQLLIIGLAVPALVAGAVTDEKQRGTLQYLLTANLDARHIVLGKLVARSGLVWLLLLTGLPLFALLAGFSGVAPFTVGLILVVLILPIFALASISLLASVWSRSTVDAVAGSYVVQIILALVVWRIGPDFLNPLYVVEPAQVSWDAMDLGAVGRRLLLSSTGWVILGGTALALAVGRLRPSYVRQIEGVPSGVAAFWYGVERAPMSDDPIHWRERHVEGLAPLATLRRFPTWFSVAAIVFCTCCSSLYLLASSLPAGKTVDDAVRAALRFDVARLQRLLPGAENGFLVQAAVVLVLATLTVAVRCAIAVTGEREKQTWESVLTSPLATKDMIQGKLWGITGASYWYLLAYGAPAAMLSVLGGVMAFFWTLLGLGVTVLAMYFVGAAGLFCSVRSTSSWRSLIRTLGTAYGGGALVLAVTGLLSVVPAALVMLLLLLADLIFSTHLMRLAGSNMDTFIKLCLFSAGGLLALAFWLLSRRLLVWAAASVSNTERMRHWQYPPIYRRARRRRFPSRGDEGRRARGEERGAIEER